MATIEQKRPARTATTNTMRAAVIEDFARPLVVEQVPKPVAGQGEIVVRIETSGLCHTDIRAAQATGRSSRRRRSSPATRGSASSRTSARV
jgi:D-arabinose 1-dehydrogenase-like Zn-dependent alcohol dehydrogenase